MPTHRLLALALLPFLTDAVAQPRDPVDSRSDQEVLDEIVVTATRTPTPASAIPGTVTILDREQIETQTLVRDELASVLEFTVPGFAPGTRKLAGRGESLRGRNPLFLIDGVPQHNALRDGQRDGYTIDLDFIERIEVINGSNAIQGVGATGGVVQMVTRQPGTSEAWETTVNTRLASDDGFDSDALSYKLSVLTGRRFENVDVALGVAWQERGLFIDANGDPVGLYPTQGDIMDSSSRGLFFKSNWRLADERSLELMVSDYLLERNGEFKSVNGNRALGILTGTVRGDPSAEVGDPARNDVTTTSLTYRQEALFGGALTAQAFDQSYEALFEGGTFGGFFRLTPDGPPFLDQSAVVSDKYGLKLTWNRPIDEHMLTLGLDWFRDDSAQLLERSDREWVPDTRFQSLAPFVQGNLALGPALNLSGGVRYEDAEVSVDDYTTIASSNAVFVTGGSPDFAETLGNLGAVWRFAEHWSLSAGYAEGFTMPDVGRVLRAVSTPGEDVDGLLAVEPIVSDNREIGLEWDNGSLRARLSAYDSHSNNGALLRLNSAGIFEVERQRTEIEGIELTLDYLSPSGWLFGGNYARTEGRYDSNRDGAIDSDLDGLNIGPDRLNLYLQGSFAERWTLRVQGSLLESREFEGPANRGNANFGGYSLVDLMLGYDSEVGRIQLGIENLFNRDYVSYFSQVETGQANNTFFAGTGRSLALSWQRTF
jgi:iron complex outermembrane receptor protein